MIITATCRVCGELYRSNAIKAPQHLLNAQKKAERIAIEHTDKFPHEVVVDPGEQEEYVVPSKKIDELKQKAVDYADKVLMEQVLLPSTNPKDEDVVRVLGNIKAALITAWAEGYREGGRG